MGQNSEEINNEVCKFLPPPPCAKFSARAQTIFNHNCYPRVLQSFLLPSIGVFHKEAMQAYEDVKAGLKYLFQTKNRWTFAISGPEELGMEAILCNLLEPGDSIGVGMNSICGHLMAESALRLNGIKVQKLEKPLGSLFSLEEISHFLESSRPKVLFLTHSEAATGFMQNLEGIGDLCQKFDCLFTCYTASLGVSPFLADELKVDAVYSSSETVISPSGLLTPISFGPRAMEAVRTRKNYIPSFYLDLERLSHQFHANELEKDENLAERYFVTPAVPSVVALREGLAILVEEGLESLWEIHAEAAQRLYFGVGILGLEFFIPKEEDRHPSFAVIKVPKGLQWEYIAEFGYEKFQVEMSGGRLLGGEQVLRICTMGYNAIPVKIDRVLDALKQGLQYARLHERLY